MPLYRTESAIGSPSQAVQMTGAEEAAWIEAQTLYAAEEVSRNALAEIIRLEAQITPRRLREAMLGNAEAIAFIQGVEDDIAIERAKL